MGFEWDEASKAGINYRKHGVRMPEAIPVFGDPCAIAVADDNLIWIRESNRRQPVSGLNPLSI